MLSSDDPPAPVIQILDEAEYAESIRLIARFVHAEPETTDWLLRVGTERTVQKWEAAHRPQMAAAMRG